MRILGIDPGYDRLGIAVIDKEKKESLVYSSCLQTSSKDDIHARLGQVGAEVSRILDEFKPDAVSIETLFMGSNKTTAMRVSEARGIIMYEAIRRDIPIHEYGPMEIKVAVTGDGRSDKERIIKMVRMLIKIPEKKTVDDEYDAIAVALTHAAHSKGSK